MDKLAPKQNGAMLTFQKQPKAFLTQVGTYLETMQKVYRTKLPADELEIWAETLKDYSFQEFDRAMKHLIDNPPKYELEDGTIQVWRGMPKLPDVVQVMLDQREKVAAEYRRRESERMRAEFAELEKRRAEHPEDFFGLADVLKAANMVDAKQAAKPMPNVRTVFPDIDPEKNADTLKKQAEELLMQQAEKLKAGTPCRTVLDPYMGSGTTLVAAKEMGMKAIGIDKKEQACEIAAKRLSQEVFNFIPA